MTSRKVRVTGGPSRWDLMISFFEQQRKVLFMTEDGEALEFVVLGMYNDVHSDSFDEDGNRFYDDGPSITYGNPVDDLFIYGVIGGGEVPITLMFHYSTRTRSGVVRIIEDADGGERGFFRNEWAKRLTQHQL